MTQGGIGPARGPARSSMFERRPTGSSYRGWLPPVSSSIIISRSWSSGETRARSWNTGREKRASTCSRSRNKGSQLALRTAIQQAGKRSAAVRTEGLRAEADGTPKVDLEVIPLKSSRADDHFLVLFETAGAGEARGRARERPARGRGGEGQPGKRGDAGPRGALGAGARATQEHLRTVIE